ncbi:hypothetical protein DL240_15970 [Lujinxingia litoralis]|uniref:Translocation and assembly module TamB C-terminal domain-containing protein n=1 Tax=Lujinxingia litoralis TaxID=2211119 RepID=A0A328C3P1_9DELT|nr:translocation/assembly module TamB domain-containing protein [Lujinxingia litoralis]RAL20536.1 hypothetical protein DL240_15970 [Lujinxingia litoralis]
MALLDDIQFRVYRSYVKIPLIFFVPALTLLSLWALVYFGANHPAVWRGVQGQLHRVLKGHLEFEYAALGPSLTTVRGYQARLMTPEREPVIEAPELYADLSALMLIGGRLEFEEARVREPRIGLHFDEGGRLNILRALGIGDEERDPEKEVPLSVGFARVHLQDADFEFAEQRFDFRVPDIVIDGGSVYVEPETVLINVDALHIAEADFRFKPELFYFPQERGDWTFKVRDFALEGWQWANKGFAVERVEADVEGFGLIFGGRMTFPGGERAEGGGMFYDAWGRLSAPFHSPLLQYFLQDNLHFDIERLDLELTGSLEEVRGRAEVDVNVLEGNGLYFEGLEGTLALNNRFVTTSDLRGEFYQGEIEVFDAFFNILEQRFGAHAALKGVDPALVAGALNQDQPFLHGALAGEVMLTGELPASSRPDPETPFALLYAAHSRFAQVEVASRVRLVRDNDLLFPNRELVLERGSQVWLDPWRVGVPFARVRSGEDRLQLRNYVQEIASMRIDAHAGPPPRFTGRLADMTPYAAYYGMGGLSGPADLEMTMKGFVGSPELALSLRMAQPGWRLDEDNLLVGDRLALDLEIEDGDVIIRRGEFDSNFGDLRAKGRVGWMAGPPAPGAPAPWPVWERRAWQPVDLDVEVRGLELALLSQEIHDQLMATGKLDAEVELGGALQGFSGAFDARWRDGSVRGQALERARARGRFDPQGVELERTWANFGSAGRFSISGRYGYAGALDVELEGQSIELAEVRELYELPMSVAGQGRFYLKGQGSVREPIFSGGAEVRDLALDGRVYGDVATAIHTLDGVVHLAGGLLPWVSVSMELPLDGSSPYYARVGMEELDLMAFLPELRANEMLDEAQVSGVSEVFIERDFSRHQALFYLTQLEVESRGQVITNRGPVAVGYNNGELIQFQQATLGSGGRYFNLTGGIMLEPRLMDVRVDGEVDLALLDSVRAGFPEYFPDFFVEAQGSATMDMRVSGPPENFLAEGSIEFGASEWDLRALPEPLSLQGGQMIFSDAGIEIPAERPLAGIVLGGQTRVAGTIGYLADQPRRLDLQMWSHNMSYRIPEMAQLAFDTNLRMQAEDWQRWETWLVSGDFNILDGLYTQRVRIVEQELAGRVFGAFNRQARRYEQSLFELIPALNDVRFDLNVRARDGFRLQSLVERLELDLEFRFDLRLRDTLVAPRISGTIDVIDGQVAFQGEAFEVRSGSVRFDDDVGNPYLDIVAGADVRNTCREADFLDERNSTMMLSSNLDATGQEYYHIIMNIRGYLNNLDLLMESNPYADQRDILSLLLTGCTVDQLTASSASRPTLEIALGPLLGRLEREIQDVVKVEEFTIMPGVERTQVRIGDALTRRLSWRFQLDTGFADATGGQQYQLKYRLSDRWSTELSERSRTETQQFLIDLKLRYRLPLD